MDVEDIPLIYGLELPARCMCTQVAETNVTRFLVATQSLKQDNQIHLISFDDENNQLEKSVFTHTSGEVWHISSSYNDPSVFATCYNKYYDGDIHSGCKLWKLPPEESSQSGLSQTSSSDHINHQNLSSIEEVADFDLTEVKNISHILWKPSESDSQVMSLGEGAMNLWDLSGTVPNLVTTYQLPEKKGYPGTITNGKWNPHHGAKQFAVASGVNVLSWDVRANEPSFHIENAHGQLVRDIDFNPNKQYYMATCGDDCLVKFWDIREPSEPVSMIKGEHSHWVWAARFNPFHDQLVLSCGSDSRVVLYNKTSISSEPFGHLVDDDDSDAENSNEEVKEPVKDGLVAVYEEHEDSVYCVEWSAADPWSFASLSYDGRVVINKVPKKVKFDILL